jgi:hypothetical protein
MVADGAACRVNYNGVLPYTDFIANQFKQEKIKSAAITAAL